MSNPLPCWTANDRFFADFGIYDSVYVKPVVVDGRPHIAAYAADGTLIDYFASVELAFVMLRQEDYEPLRVH